ncbi:MAG: tetratricopeptide repeat protein [Dermatophilaceae bacterium]
MSQPGSSSGALRGAVDLSSLGRPPASPAPGASTGLVLEVTDATFEEAFLTTRDVPALIVMWDGSAPATREAVEQTAAAAAAYDGRVRVLSIDVRNAPTIAQAFQVQQVPVTLAGIAMQPVPLFAGVQPAEQLGPVIDQVLQLAAQNGVTGRVQLAEATEVEPELPPLHARAFEAIESGDLDGAVAAYREALKENPADAEASAGLAQVSLLQRTQGLDLASARAAAAASPDDVDAQLLVADLDVLGGHVEDAFVRLVGLVRVCEQEERDRVRARLLELFEVVGTTDPRVAKARRALMSALF